MAGIMLTLSRVAVSPTTSVLKRATSRGSADLSWRLVHADGRPADVVAFEESIMAFFCESAVLLGVPKSLAAIFPSNSP